MATVQVRGFSVSLDGFGAGPEQGINDPLGKRGMELHQWFFGTKTFRAMRGEGGGSDGVDEKYAARSMEGFGAFVVGRNMFGPIRGPWPNESWKGWWGRASSLPCPRVRADLPQARTNRNEGRDDLPLCNGRDRCRPRGGAKAAAGDRDIKIGGGVATVRQYLVAGVIEDELHLAIAPVVLGRGELLFAGIDLPALGYSVTENVATESATHVVLSRA